MRVRDVIKLVNEHSEEIIETIKKRYTKAEFYRIKAKAASDIGDITPLHYQEWVEADKERKWYLERMEEASNEALEMDYTFGRIYSSIKRHKRELGNKEL